jgi:hypothetical protein
MIQFNEQLIKRLMKSVAVRTLLMGGLLSSGFLSYSQSVSGPTGAGAGAQVDYTYYNDVIYSNPGWAVSSGYVYTESSSGLNHSATVVFDCPGTQYVYFTNNGSVISSQAVSVASPRGPALPIPNATFTYNQNCGNTVITRSGTPPSNVTWYWQNSSTGTSTVLGNGPTLTVTNPGTYYLRANYNAAPCNWSGAQATASVSVNTIPIISISAASGTICSGAGSNVTVHLENGLSNVSYDWTVSGNNISGAANGSQVVSNASDLSINQTLTTMEGGYVNYLVTPSLNGCSGDAVSVRIFVVALPDPPTVTGNNRFGAGTFTLIASGGTSSDEYDWYYPSGVLQKTSAALITSSYASSVLHYGYVTITNPSHCTSLPTWVDLNVLIQPVIVSTATSVVMGSQATLSTQVAYDSYVWNNSSGTAGTTNSLTTGIADTYTVTVTQNGVSITSDPFVLHGQFDMDNINYLVSNSPLIATSDSSSIKYFPVDVLNQQVQYFDGLGLPLQTVVTQGSPARQDMVQFTYYDIFHRESRKYLPFTSGTTGDFKGVILDNNGNYTGAASGFYNGSNNLIGDAYPFSETILESSPLNRPLKDYGPGQVWRPALQGGNDKYIAHQYLVNEVSEVLLFTFDTLTGLVSTGSGTAPAYYDAGQLQSKVTTDEQGNDIVEYTDKLGHVVCKKVQYKIDDQGVKQYTSTYYLYDDFGNLVVVLPPEAVKKIISQIN